MRPRYPTTAIQGLTTAHHETPRDKRKKDRGPGYAQATGCFGWWWQVLGSNQRRLSRRFYRELPIKIVNLLWPAETQVLRALSSRLNHSSPDPGRAVQVCPGGAGCVPRPLL